MEVLPLIKNIVGILAAFTLVLSLVACNVNDGNEAFDNNDQTMNVRNNDLDNRDLEMDLAEDQNYAGDFDERRTKMGNGTMNISATNTSIPSNQYPHTKAILIQDAKFKFVQVDPKQAGDIQSRIQQELRQQLGQYGQAPGQQQTEQPEQPRQRQQTQQQRQQQAQPQETQRQQQQAQPQQETQRQQQQTQQQKQAPAQEKQAQPKGISQFAQQVIDLTNEERRKAGLPALKADAELSKVAQRKSEDMQQNNYFSHTSPTYGSPFDMMRDFGISFKTAGENIAKGQRTPQEVVNAWMNSPGHRKNILSQQFTHIGVGFEQNGYHWTQMFIGK